MGEVSFLSFQLFNSKGGKQDEEERKKKVFLRLEGRKEEGQIERFMWGRKGSSGRFRRG